MANPKLLQFLLLAMFSINIMTAEAARGKPSEDVRGKLYPDSQCSSPPVTQSTRATLTINSFEKGGSGGGPSECDGQYHSDDTLIVALSSGWFNHGSRCHHMIKISANGRSVKAMVVDECDSARGCRCNIVDGSKAVWEALGVKSGDWGLMDVVWSDA